MFLGCESAAAGEGRDVVEGRPGQLIASDGVREPELRVTEVVPSGDGRWGCSLPLVRAFNVLLRLAVADEENSQN